MTDQGATEDLLRELAPQVLAALLRRYGYGQFPLCEDATQEALLAAAVQWPADGQPGSPRGWLVSVAVRKLLDQVRSEQSRRQREERIAVATPQSELLAAAPDAAAPSTDDSLILLLGCCHPAIPAPSQVALTLRAIGGLSTAQIAAAFGVPEATMAQRISRAKQALRQADLTLPTHDDDDDDDDVDPMIALLQMLTVALGIWVPRDLALGPLLTVQREQAPPRTPRVDAPPAPLVSSAHLRPHVQRLLDSGVTAQAIAAQAGPALSTNAINVLLGEANFWVPATIAERILAIEVPPST